MELPTHWKRPWCWERLKVGGEGDDRGWDGWMASLTGWTWVWISSGSLWLTGKPGVLQSMGLQRVGHNLVTKQQQLQIQYTLPWVWETSTKERKKTGMGSHSLLQRIFLTQGSKPGLLHCRQIVYHLSRQGSPHCESALHIRWPKYWSFSFNISPSSECPGLI